MSEDFAPTPEYADAAEASAIALQRWDRHLVRCGECISVPFGGSICADGRKLLRGHEEALHQEIHAELRAAGRSLADCGECAEAEMEAERQADVGPWRARPRAAARDLEGRAARLGTAIPGPADRGGVRR